MSNAPNVIADLYGALATVAAITVALQTPVALKCFDECAALSSREKDAKRRGGSTDFVARERRSLLVRQLILNAPAIFVNVLVIVAWGYVGLHYRPVDEPMWLYLLPWYALGIAALFLIMVVLYSLASMFYKPRTVTIVSSAVGAILLLAIIGAGIYVTP